MKILLVNSVITKDYGEPVGILFLAAYLRDQGFQVEVYDPQINGDEDLSCLKEKCSRYKYEFVGISVLTSSDHSISLIERMVKVIRKCLPETTIGCGGVGTSLRYKEFLEIKEVDIVMLGEGEMTITEVVEGIKSRKALDKIPGVATKSFPHYFKRDLINTLDSIPFMARDTLEERIKGLPTDKVKNFEVRIFCGRGCFGTCTFCANVAVANLCKGERCRQRSVKSLVQEMEMLHKKYGVTRFSFWDDNFLPKGEEGIAKAIAIKENFHKLSFKPTFGIQTRVDTISDDIVKILQEAGMQNVYVGAENINEQELQILGKQVTGKQIKQALDSLYRFGYSYNSEAPYRLRIGYIAFTPFTTIDSFCENVDFVCEYNIPVNKLNKKLLAFHNTPIRTHIEKMGLLEVDFGWRFAHYDISLVYDITKKITKAYSKLYDEVRFVSKVSKYNGLPLDYEMIGKIKSELGEAAKSAVKRFAQNLKTDKSLIKQPDNFVDGVISEINDIGNNYDVDTWCKEFKSSRAKEIEEFEKAAYVFFD